MSDEPHNDEALDTFEFPAVRRMLFVDALFANGFRTAEAMRAAGYRGKALAKRGRLLVQRPDVQADIASRLAKLESEDPRFASESILHEMAAVAYMKADAASVGTKVRALELLGKYRRLFVDRSEVSVTVNPVEQFLLRRHAARNGANTDR